MGIGMSQGPDDHGGLAEAVREQPRTVSKTTFVCLYWTLLLVILLAEFAVAAVISKSLGIRLEGVWIGGLGILNLILSKVAADRILKLMGLSRSGKTVEARGRTVALPEGEVGDDEVVEVRCPPSLIMGLGVALLALCLLIALILYAVPHGQMEGGGWAYVLIGFFGLGAGYCFYERWWGTPQARADSSGITGLPVGYHMRSRFVPWSDVATCEIETYYDTFGKPVIIRPILKGSDGEPLMKLNLMYTTMDDQERLVKYIKAKLPKPKYDFWE
jgi:hypothetical protein